ncbi:DUF6221 family protein [Streptomyces sp. NBC_00024]|uniref:DUF6221 family protein n=1 Tax=Streptomyces sp. NBC_00024 TaxID=2903612 RepID=UPI0032556DE9
MPDLHGWITQQVDETQRIAEAARGQGEGRWRHESSYPNGYVYDDGDQPVVYDEGAPFPEEAAHIAFHDPASVLRRCAVDRKILARHRLNPNAYWADAAMCEGCGTTSDCDWPVTDNLNDCPELLDLGYAHGLTDEILATLDRPERGERPEPTGRSLIDDSIASMYGALYRQVMETTFASISAAEKALMTGDATGEPIGFLTVTEAPEPSPEVKAMKILAPELKKIPGYVPTTNPEA